ncbi:MAG: helicase [Bacteroides sp.]|nr:helicase [Bacteroides sp.]
MPVVGEAQEAIVSLCTDMETFLSMHYEFRFNVLTGMTEYRVKQEEYTDFRVLDERERNTIFMKLKGKKLKCTFSGLLRYIHSSLIEEYHPFKSFLDNLPSWDGRDHVSDLAARVSDNPLWIKGFHRWMLAVVAQWQGLDTVHANSVAPILISTEQGMMKSTFCKSLMPECLQAYYTDRIDMTSEGCLENKLTLMGLINMDEFDQIPTNRMAQLKNLMQTPSITIRQAYKKNFRQLPRIASFIGTSNRKDLLTDPTGSRRFLCIEVMRKIDCTNLDINQVYAQLKTELANGERYWFTTEEELEIQEHNAAFRQVRPEEELLLSHYRIPMEGEAYEMLSLVEMLNELHSEYASLLRHCDYKLFGCFLHAAGMERVHTRQGNRYKVVRI